MPDSAPPCTALEVPVMRVRAVAMQKNEQVEKKKHYGKSERKDSAATGDRFDPLISDGDYHRHERHKSPDDRYGNGN